MTSRFNYSGWFVADVPTTVAFYQKAFGLHLRYMHPSLGYAELEGENTLVAFIGAKFIANPSRLGDLRYRPDRAAAEAAAARPAIAAEDLVRDGDHAEVPAVAGNVALLVDDQAK